MGRAKPELAGARAALAASLLREPLVSPGSSLLGVIKHLVLLERLWFAHTFAGLDVALEDPHDHPPIGWPLDHSDTPRSVLGQYRAECRRSRGILERAGLDDVSARPIAGAGEVVLRMVVLHMIEQTNRHAGHADVLRCLIDGATGAPSPAGATPWS